MGSFFHDLFGLKITPKLLIRSRRREKRKCMRSDEDPFDRRYRCVESGGWQMVETQLDAGGPDRCQARSLAVTDLSESCGDDLELSRETNLP